MARERVEAGTLDSECENENENGRGKERRGFGERMNGLAGTAGAVRLKLRSDFTCRTPRPDVYVCTFKPAFTPYKRIHFPTRRKPSRPAFLRELPLCRAYRLTASPNHADDRSCCPNEIRLIFRKSTSFHHRLLNLAGQEQDNLLLRYEDRRIRSSLLLLLKR